MKNLSTVLSETFKSTLKNVVELNECVIAAKRIDAEENGDKNFIVIKHRDRNYKPSLSIVHTVVNGMEIAYLRDDTTLWSEGMNAAGICIVNSALAVDADENMAKLAKKADTAPKFSKDGERILKALTMNNIDDASFFAKNFKGGIQGHTLITDGDEVYTMEMTSQHPAVITRLDGMDLIVRTNTGIIHPDAGYQQGFGVGYKSSLVRKSTTEDMIRDLNDPKEMLAAMRKQPYAKNSQLNPRRSTSSLSTSSQLLMNPKTLSLHLVLIKDQVEIFKGIVDQIPPDFEPQIKITYEEA
jgi:hypothetical protein